MQTRYSPVDEVLTLTSGRLLCKSEELFNITNFVIGVKVSPNQLDRARNLAILFLRGHLDPEIFNISNEITKSNWRECLARANRLWPNGVLVPAMPSPPTLNPVKELSKVIRLYWGKVMTYKMKVRIRSESMTFLVITLFVVLELISVLVGVYIAVNFIQK